MSRTSYPESRADRRLARQLAQRFGSEAKPFCAEKSRSAAGGGRPAAGATARAALRIRGEALLRVELLVGCRVDELDAAIDAIECSIDVGHDAPPRARESRAAVSWCVPERA